jgi:hypothetical protein
VVLIPYRRFFQSGIAIRCLEREIPVVGPAGSSLEDLYGSDSALLVTHVDDWTRAVEHAITSGRDEAVAAAKLWWTRSRAAWREWELANVHCPGRSPTQCGPYRTANPPDAR